MRRKQAKYIDLSSAAGLAELLKLANEETFVEEGWERAVVEERVVEEQEGGRGKRVEEQERGSGSQGREGRMEGRGRGQNQDSDNRYVPRKHAIKNLNNYINHYHSSVYDQGLSLCPSYFPFFARLSSN